MSTPKTLNKNIGNLSNQNKTGYYWIKTSIAAEWTVGFYQSHLKKWNVIGVDTKIVLSPPAVINWNKIGRFEGKISKSKAIYNALDALEIGDSFVKEELISILWGEDDYFIRRSFSVMFVTARKRIIEDDNKANKPARDFHTRLGTISRIK